MADVQLRPQWTIICNSDELNLILRALGKRITADSEWQRAEELGDRLTVCRAGATKQTLQMADNTIDAVANKTRTS